MLERIRELQDERLLLRPLTPHDIPLVEEAAEEALFQRWLPWREGGYTSQSAPEFVNRYAAQRWDEGEPLWAICFAARPDHLVGVLDLRDRGRGAWEIGYWCSGEYRGQGIMTRANHLALNAAFTELGASRVMHFARVGNHSSRRVARNLGFVPEGVRRKANGSGVERQWQHSLLRSEWSDQPWSSEDISSPARSRTGTTLSR